MSRLFTDPPSSVYQFALSLRKITYCNFYNGIVAPLIQGNTNKAITPSLVSMGEMNKNQLRILLAIFCCCGFSTAQAHVKWFAPFDTHAAPLAASAVADRTFFALSLALAGVLFLGYALDRWIDRSLDVWPIALARHASRRSTAWTMRR